MNWVKQIPNFLTLSNLFLGCVGIVYLMSNEVWMQEEIPQTETYRVVFLKGNLWLACLMIFIATILDFLDGFFAKTFNAQSELGKQLDSLADLVTFGVLPGLIMFHMMSFAFFHTREANLFPAWWHFSAFLLPVFAALRLAKFNLSEDGQKKYFEGLPVPAMALFVAGLSLFFYFHEDGLKMFFLNGNNFIVPPIILLGITVLLAWLMSSSLPLLNLKFDPSQKAANKKRMTMVLIVAIISLLGFFVVKLQFGIIPLAICSYIIASLILKPQTT